MFLTAPVGHSHGEVGRGEGDGQPAEDGVVWGLLGLRYLFFILSPGGCHGRSQKLLLAGCAGHIIGVGHILVQGLLIVVAFLVAEPQL